MICRIESAVGKGLLRTIFFCRSVTERQAIRLSFCLTVCVRFGPMRRSIIALSCAIILIGCEQPSDTVIQRQSSQYSLGYLLPELSRFRFSVSGSDIVMGSVLKTTRWHDSVDHISTRQDQVFAKRNDLGDTYPLDSGIIFVNDSSLGNDGIRPFNVGHYSLPFPGEHRWSLNPSGQTSTLNESIEAPTAPRILSPSIDSAIDLSQPVNIDYSASGADSVHIEVLALIEPKDSTIDDFRVLQDQFDVPNTGSLKYVAQDLPDFDYDLWLNITICVLNRRQTIYQGKAYLILSAAVDEVSWDTLQ